MAIIEFWNAIHEGGHVVVERDDTVEAAPLEAAIRSIDAHWRLELAYEAPPLVMPVATWAVLLINRACQFLVYRDIEPPVITRELTHPSPAGPSPEACYSADLAFRVLPELITQARGLSEDDPLVLGLLELARRWPLSSVGVPALSELNIDPFVDHPSLRRLYADRIIERQDRSRLTEPRALAAVREALGAYPELAPTFREVLTGCDI